jgi:hypothetical protein
MTQVDAQLSTGLPGLDRTLRGLIPGDNLVWQVESIDDYRPLVDPYVAAAAERGRTLIYFRFARHAPLVRPGPGVQICTLQADTGFEAFLAQIHRTIERTGTGGYYVFDSLSDLAADWFSDQMLGNFFMLTCPYLYDVKAIAYFALLRGRHAPDATTPIADTAQVVCDVFRRRGQLYVHPLKVQQRHSPTMYMLHAWAGGDFQPVADSATISEIMADVPWSGLDAAGRGRGVWDRAFREAVEALDAIRRGERAPEEAADLLRRLLRMAITRDERVLRLAERYLRIEDVIEVRKRMIGTGLIGGKTVGMLLARAILRAKDPRWTEDLEVHDSFYVGADVYYTYVVRNGIWWVREKQKDPALFLDGAETARQRMLTGAFPESVRNQLADMLDYFGQSPIIVRSSSLLEDAFGNSFAGKYESVFCANQGPRQKRLEDFLSAVRTIYASSMGERALSYRAQRGLLGRDEQMALLVQRVSGSLHGRLFFPQAAGVALSYNPYVWSEYIEPEAGVLRLVFGLGTRAVDRADDDYTRVVALNAPARRPESSLAEVREYAQRKVDVIDLEANQLVSADFGEIVRQKPVLPLEVFATKDRESEAAAAAAGTDPSGAWLLTFDALLRDTPFIPRMRELLGALEEAYGVPVDTEFAANFLPDGACKINLLQCRPLQVKGGGAAPEVPAGLARDDVAVEAHGAVIGHSRVVDVDRLIYVTPAAYGQLPIAERYAVARLIGKIAHLPRPGTDGVLFLLGPGRWGTTTPSLGVPVTFAEINTVAALCEIVAMRDDLVPDVSLGTHFFNELVELDILYCALFPKRQDNVLNGGFFESAPNRLAELMPAAASWVPVIKVIDAASLPGGGRLRLTADCLKQRVVCYRNRGAT